MLSAQENAEELFRRHGGQLRMSEAIRHGITRHTLYALRDRGVIEPVTRGIYRLSELPLSSNPDLFTVGLRFPHAVVCLISALDYHDITLEIPRAIYVAVPRGTRLPSMDWPPIRAWRFSTETYEAGIETHEIDGVPVKVYDPEKTVIDCFKFRNKIGMDVVIEALRLQRERNGFNIDKLLDYAKICRVEKVIWPYLEILV